jgi:hypothetical protein
MPQQNTGDLISEPCFLTVNLLNGTRIQGRAVAYSDPKRLSPYEPFVFVDRDGTWTYLHAATISSLHLYPLVLHEE